MKGSQLIHRPKFNNPKHDHSQIENSVTISKVCFENESNLIINIVYSIENTS